MPRFRLILAILLVLSAQNLHAQASYAPQPGEIPFKVIQTTKAYDMKEILSTPFSPHRVANLKCVDLDRNIPSHKYLGTGVSLTDASCWILDRLPRTVSDSLLRAAFSPTGLNMSIARLNCGASDYATALYNYNDVKGDVKMKHFSIDRDRQYMIPVIRRAMGIRNKLFIFSSLWSVPGWMKDSGQMCGGSLLDEYVPAFANYWTEYLKAYRKAGIHIDAITVQNEPTYDQNGANPATIVTAEQEIKLAGKYLPEAFRKAGLDTKIWIHDHGYKFYERVLKELSDPTVRKNVDAVAWHPYKGKPTSMLEVRRQYPGIDFHLTERGMNFKDRSTQTVKWCADMVFNALNNGCSSFSAWNLALDEDGQPCTGCFYCRGLYEVNLDKNSFSETPLVKVFRQFSPYVERGAEILETEQPDENLKVITFRNPDGKIVICVAADNREAERQRIQIKYKDQYLIMSLPLFTWSLTTIII